MLILTYLIYLTLSVGVTVLVGHSLHRHGRGYLFEVFRNGRIADAVNHLLLVGYYLVNIAYVALALREYETTVDLQGMIEILSLKIGAVLVILGGMHFMNVLVLFLIRRKKSREPWEILDFLESDHQGPQANG